MNSCSNFVFRDGALTFEQTSLNVRTRKRCWTHRNWNLNTIPFVRRWHSQSRDSRKNGRSIADWSWLSFVSFSFFFSFPFSGRFGERTAGNGNESREKARKRKKDRGTNPLRGHTYENAILASGVEFQRSCSHDNTKTIVHQVRRTLRTRLDSSHCHSLDTLINQR